MMLYSQALAMTQSPSRPSGFGAPPPKDPAKNRNSATRLFLEPAASSVSDLFTATSPASFHLCNETVGSKNRIFCKLSQNSSPLARKSCLLFPSSIRRCLSSLHRSAGVGLSRSGRVWYAEREMMPAAPYQLVRLSDPGTALRLETWRPKTHGVDALELPPSAGAVQSMIARHVAGEF